jgi:hypothetical protein
MASEKKCVCYCSCIFWDGIKYRVVEEGGEHDSNCPIGTCLQDKCTRSYEDICECPDCKKEGCTCGCHAPCKCEYCTLEWCRCDCHEEHADENEEEANYFLEDSDSEEEAEEETGADAGAEEEEEDEPLAEETRSRILSTLIPLIKDFKKTDLPYETLTAARKVFDAVLHLPGMPTYLRQTPGVQDALRRKCNEITCNPDYPNNIRLLSMEILYLYDL